MRPSLARAAAAIVIVVVAAMSSWRDAPRAHAQAVTMQLVTGGLTQPTAIAHAGDGSGRLFIAEFAGRIMVWDGAQLSTFLDIRSKVRNVSEDGLIGLAFDPDYEDNGFFYVNYLNHDRESVLERYTATLEVANPNSGVEMKSSLRTQGNHHAGQLAFGPDGYLYFGMGDSGNTGPGGDPGEDAQNINSLWGKIWRLDVDAPPAYIPPSNPFVGIAGADEVWAMGLRNPYKFSFDRVRGDLFIADVGEDAYEEVNFQPAGATGVRNYGWDNMEGPACFEPPTGCTTAGMTGPIIVYNHTTGCSITGGYRYRGADPLLYGAYIYADYCNGNTWAAFDNGVSWTSLMVIDTFPLVTFGEGEDGEIYAGDYYNGGLYRIVTDSDFDDDGIGNAADNCPQLANAGQGDGDADALGDPCETLFGTMNGAVDSDGDGCDDGVEARGTTFVPHDGGDRDPRDRWDFFDVTGDRAIDVADAVAILGRFGAGPGGPGYDPAYDRYAPDAKRRWRTTAATGTHVGIDLEDAIVNLQSFGHHCTAMP